MISSFTFMACITLTSKIKLKELWNQHVLCNKPYEVSIFLRYSYILFMYFNPYTAADQFLVSLPEV